MDLNDIANWIAISALLPIGLFIYYYGTKPVPGHTHLRRYSDRWRATAIGRVLMRQKVVWFVFLLFVLQSIYLDFVGQDILRIVMYSLLVIQFWAVFRTLRRVQMSPPLSAGTEGVGISSDDQGPTPGASLEAALRANQDNPPTDDKTGI